MAEELLPQIRGRIEHLNIVVRQLEEYIEVESDEEICAEYRHEMSQAVNEKNDLTNIVNDIVSQPLPLWLPPLIMERDVKGKAPMDIDAPKQELLQQSPDKVKESTMGSKVSSQDSRRLKWTGETSTQEQMMEQESEIESRGKNQNDLMEWMQEQLRGLSGSSDDDEPKLFANDDVGEEFKSQELVAKQKGCGDGDVDEFGAIIPYITKLLEDDDAGKELKSEEALAKNEGKSDEAIAKNEGSDNYDAEELEAIICDIPKLFEENEVVEESKFQLLTKHDRYEHYPEPGVTCFKAPDEQTGRVCTYHWRGGPWIYFSYSDEYDAFRDVATLGQVHGFSGISTAIANELKASVHGIETSENEKLEKAKESDVSENNFDLCNSCIFQELIQKFKLRNYWRKKTKDTEEQSDEFNAILKVNSLLEEACEIMKTTLNFLVALESEISSLQDDRISLMKLKEEAELIFEQLKAGQEHMKQSNGEELEEMEHLGDKICAFLGLLDFDLIDGAALSLRGDMKKDSITIWENRGEVN